MTTAEEFHDLFKGNPTSSYNLKGTVYKRIDHGLTVDDVKRHISGGKTSALSIPIRPGDGDQGGFVCSFAAADCDRHFEKDAPIDYPSVARRITELNLPLVITASKSPKSAHVWLFFKEAEGYDCTMARKLIQKYVKLLGITGDVEIFPKQEVLTKKKKKSKDKKSKDEKEDWTFGSGINLPFFGQTRIGYGPDGAELSVEEFVALARERQSFGTVLAKRDLADVPSGHDDPYDTKSDKPLPLAAIRAIYEKVLQAVRVSNTDGHWDDALNSCAFWAGRAFAAGAMDETSEEVKAAIRTAAAAWSERDADVVEDKLTRSWDDGIAQPLTILDVEKEHAEALKRITDWLADSHSKNPEHTAAYQDLAKLTEMEFEQVRKPAAKRLKIRTTKLEKFVTSCRGAFTQKVDIDARQTNLTDEELQEWLSDLLLTTKEERAAMHLPESIEKASELAENILWHYITENATVFCTASGQGYLLFHDQKERPIPIVKEGPELSAFLSQLGIHAGAAARNRIGKHLGNQCWNVGTRVEPRISFYYNSETFTAYFAEAPGELIKVTAEEIVRVPNGTDGQLFLLPDRYEPWHVDLDHLPEATDLSPDTNTLLTDTLFSVLEYDNEVLVEMDLWVLLNAFIATLFLPGIVAGKLLLEVQGSTGSGKTLFLRMLGRMVYGKQFEVTGMDTKPEQLENAIVNNSFLVLDDVKRTSEPTILGMIRRAVTGGKCVRRELYSTFNQVEEPYRATIAISSSEVVFSGSDEMSNRELIVYAKQRTDYLDEKQLLERIDVNRNALMTEVLVRLQNIITAVKAQQDFRPPVKLRMASFTTFLLRVAKHFGWLHAAESLLESWREEQEGAAMEESVVETLRFWVVEQDQANLLTPRVFGPGELYNELIRCRDRHGLGKPWWFDKPPALIRSLRNSARSYRTHFGFHFEGRTSGHTPAKYWFERVTPKAGQRNPDSAAAGPGEKPPF